MSKKRYQLVFQFPDDFFASLDEVRVFENKLSLSLPKTHAVDGYDVGSGTINFFVYTASPEAAFRNFRKYLGTNRVAKKVRVAYRYVDGEAFTLLWPKRGTRPFQYLYKD
jgi:hypothetical protein